MIKKELLSSLLENVDSEKAVGNANQPNKAIQIIKKYELLLKGENKNIVRMVGKLKESEEFFSHVGFSRSNIYFKIRLYRVFN